jgi:hypothetical protein
LILDNYLLTDLKNKFRDQEIEITLYLPKGTNKPDASMRNYDRTDGGYLWNPDSNNEIYKVEDNKIRCLNCPTDEYNNSENDSTETSVTINEDGISVTNDTLINSKKQY